MSMHLAKQSILLPLIAILAIVLLATSIQARGAGASPTSRSTNGRALSRLMASPPPVYFQLAGTYDAGYHPRHMAKGDFNTDGKLDFAVSNWYGSTISVLPGDGTGAFPSRTSYSGGGNPWSIAAADLNNDGKLDLVTGNPDNGTANVFLGSGTGTFQAPTAYPAGYNPENLAVGDLNNDNVLDVAVASYFGGTAGALLGTGTGALGPLTSFTAGSGPGYIALADLNGDHALDIVVPNFNGNNVGVLLGNGNGTFANVSSYSVGVNPRFVAIGDLNNDSKLDLAVANNGGNSVSILLGNGNGTFLGATLVTVGSAPNGIALGDLNGDSNLDLVVTNGGANNVGVLLGNGDGTFQGQVTYSTGTDPLDVMIADLNGDTKLDFVTINFYSNTLSVFLNGDAPTPTSTPTSTVTPSPTSTATPSPTSTATPSPTSTPIPTTTSTPTSTQPPVAQSLTINGGALTTTSANVSLHISASNADGSQTGLSMSFSNNGTDWSAWQPYAPTTSWQLAGSDGEKTVYGRFKNGAGGLSAIVSDTITLDTSVQSEYGLTINEGALYTNRVAVRLTISAKPGTAGMQVSNDGGFSGISWEPYSSRKNWQITSYGHHELPRIVYIRFRDSDGNISATYQDDIILDITAPHGDAQVANTNQGVVLHLDATDDLSGVGSMQVSAQSDFAGANWESFAANRPWSFGSNSTVYVQFRDNAGNISQTYSAARDEKLFLPLVAR
jgi:hypothetical protein